LEIAVGSPIENNEIIWDIGVKSRKKIISLSDLLKEEGLDYLKEDGLTEKEWESIFQLLEEKLGKQPEMVFLFDLEQLGTGGNSFSSQLSIILKNLINFLSEKISEMGNKLLEIGEKIDEVSTKLEGITLTLLNIGEKIDRLYQVLVIDRGLDSEGLLSESNGIKKYTAQKFERLIIKKEESSIRIFNQSIETESLIFVSFLDDPGCSWWISEKVPGSSFDISLKEPASQDLRFDYWILDEEGGQQLLPSTTTDRNQLPEEQPAESEKPGESEEEQAEETTTIEATTTIDNQLSGEQSQPVSPEMNSGTNNEEQPLESSEELPPQNNQEN
jgi:hypothetical protein